MVALNKKPSILNSRLIAEKNSRLFPSHKCPKQASYYVVATSWGSSVTAGSVSCDSCHGALSVRGKIVQAYAYELPQEWNG